MSPLIVVAITIGVVWLSTLLPKKDSDIKEAIDAEASEIFEQETGINIKFGPNYTVPDQGSETSVSK